MQSRIPADHKIAERLIFLSEKTRGSLIRLYNIRKACNDSRSKPWFLTDKKYENVVRHINKKYPRLEKAVMGEVFDIRGEMIKSLSTYYFTMVDLVELKDNILDLLATIDVCHLRFDVEISAGLLTGYLDLISSIVRVFLLLAQISDRKVVTGLYSVAISSPSEKVTFGRLSQMIADYEHPIVQLSTDFGSHSPSVRQCIESVSKLLNCGRHDRFQCRTVTEHEIHQWIFFCSIACPGIAQDSHIREILVGIARTNTGFRLCRDLSLKLSELFNATSSKWASKTFPDWHDALVNKQRKHKISELLEYHEHSLDYRRLISVHCRLTDGDFAITDECFIALKRMVHVLEWHVIHETIQNIGQLSEILFLLHDCLELINGNRSEIKRVFSHLIGVECSHLSDDLISKPLTESLVNEKTDLSQIELDWLRTQVVIASRSLSSYQKINFGRLSDAVGWFVLAHEQFDFGKLVDLSCLVFNTTQIEQCFENELNKNQSFHIYAYLPAVSNSIQHSLHNLCPEERSQLYNLGTRLHHRMLAAILRNLKGAVFGGTSQVDSLTISRLNLSLSRIVRTPRFFEYVSLQLRNRLAKLIAPFDSIVNHPPPTPKILNSNHLKLISALTNLQLNEQTILKLYTSVFASASKPIAALSEIYCDWSYTDKFMDLCARGKVAYIPTLQTFQLISTPTSQDELRTNPNISQLTSVSALKSLASYIGIDRLSKIKQNIENVLSYEANSLRKEVRCEMDPKSTRRACERILKIGSSLCLSECMSAAIKALAVECFSNIPLSEDLPPIASNPGTVDFGRLVPALCETLIRAWCLDHADSSPLARAMVANAFCIGRAIEYIVTAEFADPLVELITVMILNHECSCGLKQCGHRMIRLVLQINPNQTRSCVPNCLWKELNTCNK